MISRILSFLLLCIILFFGFFIIPSFLDTQDKNAQSYDAYLSRALLRNTPIQKKYSVSFLQNDFLGITGSKHASLGYNSMLPDSLYFRESEFNRKLALLNNYGEQNIGEGGSLSLPKADFQNLNTLSSQDISSRSLSLNTNCDGGILYDPCIDPLDPFLIGADGKMFLGKTPIHRYPDEVAF